MRSSNALALRLAGVAAVVAGTCYVLVGLFHPPNVSASVTSTRWEVVHYLACAMCFFGLLGMAGLYARQARQSRLLNLIGYALLSLWFTIIMGFSFIEAFVLPQVSATSPRFVDGWMAMLNGTNSTVDLGALTTLWLLTGPVYMLGGLVFGIAIYRSGILPRWAGVLLAAGTVLAPVAGLLPLEAQPKVAVPVGLAFIWLGYGLWSNPGRELPGQRLPTSSRDDVLGTPETPVLHSPTP